MPNQYLLYSLSRIFLFSGNNICGIIWCLWEPNIQLFYVPSSVFIVFFICVLSLTPHTIHVWNLNHWWWSSGMYLHLIVSAKSNVLFTTLVSFAESIFLVIWSTGTVFPFSALKSPVTIYGIREGIKITTVHLFKAAVNNVVRTNVIADIHKW